MSAATPVDLAAVPPPPARRAKRRYSIFGEALILLRLVLEILVIATFIVTFIVQPFRIPSASMQPTLFAGDFGLADKQSFEPEGPLSHLLPPAQVARGDLMVFHYPVDPRVYLVKRVVGVPGDRIRLRAGHVWINEQPIAEPYAFYSPAQANPFRDDFPWLPPVDPALAPPWWGQLRRAMHDGEVTVPAGQYFVLGDNRNDSEDSRYCGFVPGSEIVGRPLLVYFSLRRPVASYRPFPLVRRLGADLRILR